MDTLFFDLNILKIKVKVFTEATYSRKSFRRNSRKNDFGNIFGNIFGENFGEDFGEDFREDFGENSINIYLKKVQYCYFLYLF